MRKWTVIWIITICGCIGWNLFCQSTQAGQADDVLDEIFHQFKMDTASAAEIRNFFIHVSEQHDGELELLYERLREGLVKNADEATILKALEKRVRALKEARDILAVQLPCRDRQAEAVRIVRLLVHALESGMPSEPFRDLLAQQRNQRQRQMQAIIEAAERMYLAEIETDSIHRFMLESRDRQLRRMQILRAAQFWIDRSAEGIDDAVIIKQLREKWENLSPPAATPPRRRRQQR